MKLYYSAGSCSTSCHITLEESGLKYEAIEVDFDQASDPNLVEAMRLNPLGTLPVLVTDQGKVLDQNLAIHTYVAQLAKKSDLLPAAGTLEYAETLNWVSFVAADLHKSFGPLFGLSSISQEKQTQADVRKWALGNVNGYLAYVDKKLQGRDYLTGKNFTIADAYCFVVIGWTKYLEIPLDAYKNVQGYLGRVAERPAVHKVLKTEGLLD